MDAPATPKPSRYLPFPYDATFALVSVAMVLCSQIIKEHECSTVFQGWAPHRNPLRAVGEILLCITTNTSWIQHPLCVLCWCYESAYKIFKVLSLSIHFY